MAEGQDRTSRVRYVCDTGCVADNALINEIEQLTLRDCK